MGKIITGTGKEFDCGFAGVASVGFLYLIIQNSTFGEVASVFSNPAETAELNYKSANDVVFDGYTVFINMVNEAEGIRVSLRKPYVGEE